MLVTSTTRSGGFPIGNETDSGSFLGGSPTARSGMRKVAPADEELPAEDEALPSEDDLLLNDDLRSEVAALCG